MLNHKMRVKDVALLLIVAIFSLRWIGSAAVSGPSSIALWILAALCFYIPQALTVASLSSEFSEEGGLYAWADKAFGPFHGFICGWCYWINNLIYFPSILIFITTNIAIAIHYANPALSFEKNSSLILISSLFILWLVAYLCFRGLKTTKFVQNVGGTATWIPAVILILFGSISFYLFGVQQKITVTDLIPAFKGFSDLSFFSQICFALAGVEILSFSYAQIQNPKKDIPKAIFISSFVIVFLYILGTLSVILSVEPSTLTVLNSILAALFGLGNKLSLTFLAWVAAISMILSYFGGILAWFNAASKLPYLVGVNRYLPSALAKVHPRYNTPHVSIATQTIVATLLTIFAAIGVSTLEQIYKILVDMCALLYFIPFLYLFLIRIKFKSEKLHFFQGKALPFIGFLMTCLAIMTTLIPPEGFQNWIVPVKTISGTFFMIFIGLLFYRRSLKKI